MNFIKIAPEEFFTRIAISPPYFAISDIYRNDDVLTAKAMVEQQCSLEAAPISSAEAGRHMSALGECSLALGNKNPERVYFLAKEARYQRLLPDDCVGEITLEAKSSWLNAKSASASIKLMANNHQLINLDINYFPFPASVFERSFKNQKQKTVSYDDKSPYASLPAFLRFKTNEDQLWGYLGEIGDKWCHGHFENYPVLPAAMLMGKVLNLFEAHIQELLKTRQFKFYVENAVLTAQNIAFAGDNIKMVSNRKYLSPSKARFEGIAFNDRDQIICDLQANIRIILI